MNVVIIGSTRAFYKGEKYLRSVHLSAHSFISQFLNTSFVPGPVLVGCIAMRFLPL